MVSNCLLRLDCSRYTQINFQARLGIGSEGRNSESEYNLAGRERQLSGGSSLVRPEVSIVYGVPGICTLRHTTPTPKKLITFR